MSDREFVETIPVELDIGTRVLEIHQLDRLDERTRRSVVRHTDAPYWGYLWPSARALARFIGERTDLAGKRVLDLGCGLGPLGVAAAARGAEVVVADIQPNAVDLAVANARRNQLVVEGRLFDFASPPEDLGRFDFVVAADILYEDGMLAGVLRFLRRHLGKHGAAWIADPMRVTPAGVQGAARLHGLEAASTVLCEGHTMTGGVMLHELRPRGARI